jgi:hypothetical protein
VIWIVLGTIAIVGATIGLGVVIDRKWGLLPRAAQLEAPRQKLLAHAAGEAPEAAIAASPMAIEKLRRDQRCPQCKSPMDARADDRVSYDGRELIVLHFQCPRDATKRSLYVAPTVA